jgi:hypothetical protein
LVEQIEPYADSEMNKNTSLKEVVIARNNQKLNGVGSNRPSIAMAMPLSH